MVIIDTKKLPKVESKETMKPWSDNLNKSNLQFVLPRKLASFVISNILPVYNNGNHLYIQIEIGMLYIYNV